MSNATPPISVVSSPLEICHTLLDSAWRALISNFQMIKNPMSVQPTYYSSLCMATLYSRLPLTWSHLVLGTTPGWPFPSWCGRSLSSLLLGHRCPPTLGSSHDLHPTSIGSGAPSQPHFCLASIGGQASPLLDPPFSCLHREPCSLWAAPLSSSYF